MADSKTTEIRMSGGQSPKDAASASTRDVNRDEERPTSSAVKNDDSTDLPAIPSIATTSGDQDDTIQPSGKGKEKENEHPVRPASASRQDTLAIGPSVDSVQPLSPSGGDGLVCNITLLLTTGARHPYRIDEKYLTKRNVAVPGLTEDGKKDPFTISVYTLKELILREWRDEWDPKPASPSSIRLIHFGKLLDDKDQLKQYHFSSETANVVHMTVRPADIIEEEEPKGGNKTASGGGRNREGGSGCCVIL